MHPNQFRIPRHTPTLLLPVLLLLLLSPNQTKATNAAFGTNTIIDPPISLQIIATPQTIHPDVVSEIEGVLNGYAEEKLNERYAGFIYHVQNVRFDIEVDKMLGPFPNGRRRMVRSSADTTNSTPESTPQRRTAATTYGTELILHGTIRFSSPLPPHQHIMHSLYNALLDYDSLRSVLIEANIAGIQPDTLRTVYYDPDAPSASPSGIPSGVPSGAPSGRPSGIPTARPSSIPSDSPSSKPSVTPSETPSDIPTEHPSNHPTTTPSQSPTTHPSTPPTTTPSQTPTSQHSIQPTHHPSTSPTTTPSSKPTSTPSHHPSQNPTVSPSHHPSVPPTTSYNPSLEPTPIPSTQPTITSRPSTSPSPTAHPTPSPSTHPTIMRSSPPSSHPSSSPTPKPSSKPSSQPSTHPSTPPTTTIVRIVQRSESNTNYTPSIIGGIIGTLFLASSILFSIHFYRRHKRNRSSNASYDVSEGGGGGGRCSSVGRCRDGMVVGHLRLEDDGGGGEEEEGKVRRKGGGSEGSFGTSPAGSSGTGLEEDLEAGWLGAWKKDGNGHGGEGGGRGFMEYAIANNGVQDLKKRDDGVENDHGRGFMTFAKVNQKQEFHQDTDDDDDFFSMRSRSTMDDDRDDFEKLVRSTNISTTGSPPTLVNSTVTTNAQGGGGGGCILNNPFACGSSCDHHPSPTASHVPLQNGSRTDCTSPDIAALLSLGSSHSSGDGNALLAAAAAAAVVGAGGGGGGGGGSGSSSVRGTSSPLTTVTPTRVSKEEFETDWDTDLPWGPSTSKSNTNSTRSQPQVQQQQQRPPKNSLVKKHRKNSFHDGGSSSANTTNGSGPLVPDGSFPTLGTNTHKSSHRQSRKLASPSSFTSPSPNTIHPSSSYSSSVYHTIDGRAGFSSRDDDDDDDDDDEGHSTLDWSDKGSFDASTIDDSLTTANAEHNGVIVVGGGIGATTTPTRKKFGIHWPGSEGGRSQASADKKKGWREKRNKQRKNPKKYGSVGQSPPNGRNDLEHSESAVFLTPQSRSTSYHMPIHRDRSDLSPNSDANQISRNSSAYTSSPDERRSGGRGGEGGRDSGGRGGGGDGGGGSNSSYASSSKQLINDLVWLEKKIADVKSRVNRLDSLDNKEESDPNRNDNDELLIDSSNSTTTPSRMRSPNTITTNTTTHDYSSSSPISGNIICRDFIAPPGKLQIVIHSTKDGPTIHDVRKGSSLYGRIFPGDLLVAVDDVDTRTCTAEAVMDMMIEKSLKERKLTVLHFEKFK